MGIRRSRKPETTPDLDDYVEPTDADDEEEAPAPVRRSRKPAPEPEPEDDDDDEDEEPAPRSRSRRSAPAAAAKPARRSGRRTPEPEDDDFDDEDDDDDEPAVAVPVRQGWGALASVQKALSSGHEFKIEGEDKLIKFISPSPFEVRQHWIERDGKRSFLCIGEGCPLCRSLGDTPSSKFVFTVVDLTGDDEEAEDLELIPQLLLVGVRLAEQIRKLDEDPRNGPLSKHFYTISRTGGGGGGKKGSSSVAYSLQTVKARDLLEDWELDPKEIEAELKAIKPLDVTALHPSSKKELQAIVREVA